MRKFRKKNGYVVDESGTIILRKNRTIDCTCVGLTQDEVNQAFSVFDTGVDLPEGWGTDENGDYAPREFYLYVQRNTGNIFCGGQKPEKVLREACDIADQDRGRDG